MVDDDGLDAVLADLGVPRSFPPEVTAAAEGLPVIDAAGRDDRRDLPLVTIDPEGSTDLDQALAIEETASGGHVVWYAIADVAVFVEPGGAIDVESHERGVTLYAPQRRAPLHPAAMSEDAASLLAERDRPAVLWRLELDRAGDLVDTDVGRAMVRSREQLAYADAQRRIDAGDPLLAPLAEVGRRRQRLEHGRGGINLPVPEQEVVAEGDGYRLAYRAVLDVEEWNAQLSLLCGMAAAEVMLDGGWGLLRTLPPAPPEAIAVLRRHAVALDVEWGPEDTYGDVVRRLDTTRPHHAAFAVQCTRLFRGAGYLPLTGQPPAADEVVTHAAIAAPYAHVTAPLRRLGDRYATECVLSTLAGEPPPSWVLDALDALPSELQSGSSRAGNLERAVRDHLEARVLAGSIGSEFPAVVVDHHREGARIQIVEPAIVATVDGEHPLGSQLTVRVDATDPVARTVDLSVVDAGG